LVLFFKKEPLSFFPLAPPTSPDTARPIDSQQDSSFSEEKEAKRLLRMTQ
jgi:hypothetical protein